MTKIRINFMKYNCSELICIMKSNNKKWLLTVSNLYSKSESYIFCLHRDIH